MDPAFQAGYLIPCGTLRSAHTQVLCAEVRFKKGKVCILL